MDFSAILTAARTIDLNNFILIVLCSISATYLVREFLKPPFWMPILILPAMFASAWFGAAILKANSVFISSEVSVNMVLGAMIGLVSCFVLGAVGYRIYAELFDATNFGPYRPKNDDVQPPSDGEQ